MMVWEDSTVALLHVALAADVVAMVLQTHEPLKMPYPESLSGNLSESDRKDDRVPQRSMIFSSREQT
jgi:hypothetical protein